MWSTAEQLGSDAVLNLNPDHGDMYIPGGTYSVSVTYPGMSTGMLGSSGGAWTNSNCKDGNGVYSTMGTWTAPPAGHGAVTIGGTLAASVGELQTTERVLVPIVGSTAPTMLTTEPPTAAPNDTGLDEVYTHWEFAYEPHSVRDATAPPGFEYHLNWNITADRIIIKIRAPTTGWLGFGIGEYGAGAMPGGDFVICRGEGTVEDRWAPGYVTPNLDSKQDWTLHYAGQSSFETWCILSRALDTGDLQDRALEVEKLVLGAVNLMFAYGSSDSFNQHSSTQRTTAQVSI